MSYYLTDHLGSTRAVVDDNGQVLETFDYYPFGLLMPKRNTAGANTLEKFTGKERDTEGGLNLDYFGARYYDPVIGRWTSTDPYLNIAPTDTLIKNGYLSVTPYGYVSNNPVLIIDPDGMRECPPDCGLLDRIQSYLTGAYTGEHEFNQVDYTQELSLGAAKEGVTAGIQATDMVSDQALNASMVAYPIKPEAGEALSLISLAADGTNLLLKDIDAKHFGGSQQAVRDQAEKFGAGILLTGAAQGVTRSLIKPAPAGVRNVNYVSGSNNPLTGYKGRFVKNAAANRIYGSVGIAVAAIQSLFE